jgi:hypothetical protein
LPLEMFSFKYLDENKYDTSICNYLLITIILNLFRI